TRFRDQIDGSAAQQAAASRRTLGGWFYDQLLAPVEQRIAKSQRLLIMADGPLHYLPFAALVRNLEDTATGRDWQYLVEWKPVHTAVSATVYAELRKMRRPDQPAIGQQRLQLAAFGNPAYPPATTANERAPAAVRNAIDRGIFDGLTPLPHSGREVAEIGKLFANNTAQTFLGKAATEEQAKAVGKEARIVHFAVHGALDPYTPLVSFLALTIPDKAPEGTDNGNGLLQAWEIFE
ncbi:MAG: CHAT domain-containing protein, partial [Herbaspirillum sp.]|uniref:CHAT domain-containing protein n=1 Tax=Herbaspirillum sp. TaxID=1890675 RepID=UPI0025835AC4